MNCILCFKHKTRNKQNQADVFTGNLERDIRNLHYNHMLTLIITMQPLKQSYYRKILFLPTAKGLFHEIRTTKFLGTVYILKDFCQSSQNWVKLFSAARAISQLCNHLLTTQLTGWRKLRRRWLHSRMLKPIWTLLMEDFNSSLPCKRTQATKQMLQAVTIQLSHRYRSCQSFPSEMAFGIPRNS